MFKKLNNKKIFSLLLALVLVLGMSVSSFADVMLRNYVTGPQLREAGSPSLTLTMDGDPTIAEDSQDVGGVTTYTKFAQYLSGSSADLEEIDTAVSFNGADKVAIISNLDPYNAILDPNGPSITSSQLIALEAKILNDMDTETIDYTGAPVAFLLLDEISTGTYNYVRNYWVSAGRLGDPIAVKLKVNVENVVDWLNGSYTSTNPMFAGKVPTTAATNAVNAEARFRDAMGLPATGTVPSSASNYIDLIIETEVGKTVQEAMDSGIYYLADGTTLATGMDGSFFDGLSSGYVSEIKKYPVVSNPVTIPHLIFTEYNVSIPGGAYDGTGWVYKVNNFFADRGMGQYYLTTFENYLQNSNAEGIEWGYTFDWGVDCGGPVW